MTRQKVLKRPVKAKDLLRDAQHKIWSIGGGPRKQCAGQIAVVAVVARGLSKEPALKHAVDKRIGVTRLGSSPHLALVKHLIPGLPPPTARRYADAVHRCIYKKWSPKQIRMRLLKAGPTKLARLNVRRLHGAPVARVKMARRP